MRRKDNIEYVQKKAVQQQSTLRGLTQKIERQETELEARVQVAQAPPHPRAATTAKAELQLLKEGMAQKVVKLKCADSRVKDLTKEHNAMKAAMTERMIHMRAENERLRDTVAELLRLRRARIELRAKGARVLTFPSFANATDVLNDAMRLTEEDPGFTAKRIVLHGIRLHHFCYGTPDPALFNGAEL